MPEKLICGMDYKEFWDKYISMFLGIGDDIAFLVQLTNCCSNKNMATRAAGTPLPIEIDEISAADKSSMRFYAAAFGLGKTAGDFPVKGDINNFYASTVALYLDCSEIMANKEIALSLESKSRINSCLDELLVTMTRVKYELLKETKLDLDEWTKPNFFKPMVKNISSDQEVKYGENNLIYDAVCINLTFGVFQRSLTQYSRQP